MARAIAAVALIGALACKATPPSHIEQLVAAEVKRRITVGGRADRNPVPATPDAVRDGQAAFLTNCSMCHGLDGRNSGVPFARNMSPPVPELTSRGVQEYTDGQLHSIVENGLSPSGMPAARGILTDSEIWQIVLYIRELSKSAALESSTGEQARAAASGATRAQ